MSSDSQSVFLEMNEVEDFHSSNYLENFIEIIHEG